MIATLISREGFGKCIMLVFDDGSYAIHHGMSVWTLWNNQGDHIGQFDAFGDHATNHMTRSIQDYSCNGLGKRGRIS